MAWADSATSARTDQYDPLISEGKLLADNLQKAGVPVKHRSYEGGTHGFSVWPP